MFENDEKRQAASDVWVRTGRPAVSVLNMSDAEVDRLIEIGEMGDSGSAIQEFIGLYLDARKASESDDAAKGFSQPKEGAATNAVEETTELDEE